MVIGGYQGFPMVIRIFNGYQRLSGVSNGYWDFNGYSWCHNKIHGSDKKDCTWKCHNKCMGYNASIMLLLASMAKPLLKSPRGLLTESYTVNMVPLTTTVTLNP